MKKLLFALLSLSLAFTACKKNNNNNNNNPNNNAPAPAPQPNFASGNIGLVAIKALSSSVVAGFPIKTEIGTGAALFGDLAAQSYVDAGDVKLNDNLFTKSANNTYYFAPSQNAPTGIDLSSNIVWNVGGNNGNNIPNFTLNVTSQGMPSTGDLDVPASIDANNDFTLKVNGSISNSDSVYFQIVGSNGTNILKRKAANTSSALFTAAELQTLGKGMTTITIAPFNVSSYAISGKTVYAVNEVALSSIVEIK